MEVQLKVLVGSSAGQTIKVPGPKFYIGRSEDCQLRPRSDLISRHHCALIVEGEYVAVRDFGSKNGTYVNGERVSSEQELKAGDHVKIGPLEFEVLIDVGGLGGPKKPKVTSVKEAAARSADSGVIKTKENEELDLSQWLGEDLVQEADTREMPSPSETTEVSLGKMTGGTGDQPIAPPKAGEDSSNKPPSKSGDSKAGDSNEAAAEMLRKLRRYR